MNQAVRDNSPEQFGGQKIPIAAEALKGLSFSYAGVCKHLERWINFDFRWRDLLCFIDCTLSDFEHNLSFALELSPFKDECDDYLSAVKTYLEEGYTVGGHSLFKMGLPTYSSAVDTKQDFDGLSEKSGYGIGLLVKEIVGATNIERRAPQGIIVQHGTESEVLAKISPCDTLSMQTAFEKYVLDCCAKRHDMHGRGVKYVIGIPICRLPLKREPQENDMCACVFVGISNAIQNVKMAMECANDIRHFFNESILPVFSELKTSVEQTKSAIGAIMSRNGSHNIGSHVLAALTDHIGTMPDDKVLYQYIQHRMDYIATATTNFPAWRQPTMFLGNMMKTFLSQRHLLENIAGSEGLRAWKFQGRNCFSKDHVATVKLRIRRDEGEKKIDLLQYEVHGGRMDLTNDIALAIPGGTVGQHAFFTIIENIVRNAAKHDWSSPPVRTRKNKFAITESGEEVINGNLEIFIDFKDIPEEGNVEFTIFSNMSDADDKIEGDNDNLSLLGAIGKSIDTKFINEYGALRKEDWGIAEMKISVGYLQNRETGVIGGLGWINTKGKLDEVKFGENLISAVARKIDANDEVNHLGYTFKVPKTRTLLIVVDDAAEIEKLDSERKKLLARHGVYVKSASEAELGKADNSFEFILMNAFSSDRLKWLLPFRVVCMQPCNCCAKTADRVAIWDETDETTESIVGMLAQSPLEDVERNAESILTRLSACWVSYLKRRRKLIGPLNLTVSTETGNEKKGQGLVNPASAVRFVLEEGFDRAIDSFWKLTASDIRACRKDWLDETKIAIDILKKSAELSDVDESVKQSDGDYSSIVIKQFELWLKDCRELSRDGVLKYLHGKEEGGAAGIGVSIEFKNHPFKKFVDYIIEVCAQAKGYLGQYAEQIVTLPEDFSTSTVTEGVVDNNTCKVFSCGGVTLNGCTGVNIKDVQTIKYYRHYDPCISKKKDDEAVDFIANPFKGTNDIYVEPLSGTQSYLSQMRDLVSNKHSTEIATTEVPKTYLFIAKLVECALMRILIVDERMSRFVNNHSALTLATLSLMNIFVGDDKTVTDELEAHQKAKRIRRKSTDVLSFNSGGLVELDTESITLLRSAIRNEDDKGLQDVYRRLESFHERFDVLIIHQGILDKWFHGVVSNSGKMAVLYDSFKKVFPYVIITTGRGTPANIPNMARVLPFSTIETTLFRKYPEKLVLVDAIMNILPVKR